MSPPRRFGPAPLSPLWKRLFALAVFSLLISIFAWWPMIGAYPLTQGGDGQFFHKMIEATRISLVRWHELPLWNPYECGGVPLWDNPQGVAAAPLVWPAAIFGSTRTIEAWYVIHSAIGFASMWLLARTEFRLTRGAAFIAAASWAFCGFHHEHYMGGHFSFVPFLYFPLALLFWRRAETDARMAVGLGLIVAITVYEGGIYPLPHLALMLGAETLTRLWPVKRIVPIARAGLIVIAVGFCVGAARFLPVADQLRSHTRDLGVETDAMQWSTLKAIFLDRDHTRHVVGQTYVWPEYADYIGPIVFGLACLGVFLGGLENAWVFVLLAWAVLLMLGYEWKYAPWPILKGHVFPFKQMRVPSRFVATVTMWISIYAGIAIDRIETKARRFVRVQTSEAIRLAVLGIALLGAGEMIGVGITWCAQCFNAPPEVKVERSPNFYLGGPGLAAFLDTPRQNRGRLECWEEWAFNAGAPLWTGDLPQAKAADGGAVVSNVTRTQSTFTFDVDAARPSRVLVNSTYDRGWRTSAGALDILDKQLVLDVPAGHHHVRLWYWPHGLTLGLWITSVSVVALLAYAFGFRKLQCFKKTSP